ncbi:MAG TPA: FtsX-like permease family protein [Bacteroidales bacterium]|nr:FtsX-like permease family protein [Bacteroidales bacterium]
MNRNRLYSFVTLSGFSISLMFVLLLSVYIKQELSVDRFHKNKDRIYRLYREQNSMFAPMIGEYIKSRVPEVESYTRIKDMSGSAIFPGNQKIRLNYLLADSSFFTMFSFGLKEGTPGEVLKTKDKAVLSESFASKMFGEEDPVGKSFELNNKLFIISGIIPDMSQNTHFNSFDAVITFDMLAEFWNYPQLLTTFSNSSFGLYFLAKEGTDLPSKAPLILEDFKKDYWLYQQDRVKELRFEPLSDVYFSNSTGPAIRNNNRNAIFMFGGIAILILVIAIINYINLTIAQGGNRSKEIAIRKIMGGAKGALIFQRITESVVISLFAAFVAIWLAFIAEPFFNNQMDTNLHLSDQIKLSFVFPALIVIVLTGIISGLIPALSITRFNPAGFVKGNITFKTRTRYSKILIGFQYTVAVILLITTLTIVRQSEFMKNYDMGFNKENLYWMDYMIEPSRKAAFRNELKSIPGVEEVSYCSGMPIDGGNNQSFVYNDKPVSFQEFYGDSLYLDIFGIKVKETNNAYSKDGVWINRTAVKTLELDENPTSFKFYDTKLSILGVVDDYNFRSLHQQVGPAIIRQLDQTDSPWSVVMKISGSNIIETVKKIKEKQLSFSGGMPVESGFIDSSIDQWYTREVKQSKLIGAFTLLSIIISSMGIFAMSLYYIQQKIKEIGIRKVNGAKVREVVAMLNSDFIKWVSISFIIACPIAWYAMHKWLENFAYKTTMDWWIFALAGATTLAVALLTVSWQSWKAATRNPVEALRYE